MKGTTDKTNILTERQKAVLKTIRMRLTEKEVLEYLRNADLKCQILHGIVRRNNWKK
jgi:hypothetical protein